MQRRVMLGCVVTEGYKGLFGCISGHVALYGDM